MHTITSRAPTQDEQALIVSLSKPDWASFGCLCLFLGLVPVLGFGWVGGWVAGLFAGGSEAVGMGIGWVIGLLVFASVLGSFMSFERKERSRARKDAEGGVLQVISVSEARVLEIGLINDIEPILVFDIGDGKLLFLQGQWLRDPETYGAPEQEGDPLEEFLNGLSEPYAFPSSTFTITRLPHSGRVLGIEVAGSYLEPGQLEEALQPEFEFCDSEVFEGDLDRIAEVLLREHRARVGKHEGPG